VRYFGFYSSKARGLRAKANRRPDHVVQIDDDHTSRRLADCDPDQTHLAGRSAGLPPLHHAHEDRQLEDRAAPREPDPGQLRYVSDLQFVDEPAPAEPVWTAH
jgi:hypothetical protein